MRKGRVDGEKRKKQAVTYLCLCACLCMCMCMSEKETRRQREDEKGSNSLSVKESLFHPPLVSHKYIYTCTFRDERFGGRGGGGADVRGRGSFAHSIRLASSVDVLLTIMQLSFPRHTIIVNLASLETKLTC